MFPGETKYAPTFLADDDKRLDKNKNQDKKLEISGTFDIS